MTNGQKSCVPIGGDPSSVTGCDYLTAICRAELILYILMKNISHNTIFVNFCKTVS